MKPHAAPRRRGFTLIEVMATLAVLAVLGTLAWPSLGASVQRQRLAAAAEALAADLAQARFEAARRGQALHVEGAAGAGWCWAVALASGCGCGDASPSPSPSVSPSPACRLKTEQAQFHPGVRLLDPLQVHLDPLGAANVAASARFESPRGDQLRVELTPLGRARICNLVGDNHRYPRC